MCMMLIMSFTSVNAISYLWNFTGDGEGWEFSYGEGANFADNNFKSGSDSSGALYYYNITSPFGFPLNYSLNYVSGGGNQMRMGIHNESAVISPDWFKFLAYFHDGAGDIYTISNEVTLYTCDNDDNFFSDGDIVGLYMPNSFEVEYYSNGVLVCNYTSETPLIDSSDIFLFLGSRTDLVILDDVKFEYNDLPLCIPDWVCDGYDNCMTNNTQNCNSVVDNNSCGELYAGDYSEFNPQMCDFCIPNWLCDGYGSCMINNTQNCNAVADDNGCFAITGLVNDTYSGDYSEFTPAECNYCTISESPTIICENSFYKTYYTNNNFASCCNVTGIPADCTLTANTTGVSCYVPAHTSADVPAVAIDLGVEFGLQMITLVAIIVIGAGGVYIYKMVRKK